MQTNKELYQEVVKKYELTDPITLIEKAYHNLKEIFESYKKYYEGGIQVDSPEIFEIYRVNIFYDVLITLLENAEFSDSDDLDKFVYLLLVDQDKLNFEETLKLNKRDNPRGIKNLLHYFAISYRYINHIERYNLEDYQATEELIEYFVNNLVK